MGEDKVKEKDYRHQGICPGIQLQLPGLPPVKVLFATRVGS